MTSFYPNRFHVTEQMSRHKQDCVYSVVPSMKWQPTGVAGLTIFVEQHENFRLQPLLAGFAPPKLLASTQIHGSLFKKLPCTKNPASIMRPC